MVPLRELSPTAKASEKAYYQLRKLIVSLKLAPGSPVDEKTLSSQLGLGRTPVREALLKLADESLVDILSRKGTFIAPIRLQELKAVEELRWQLESLAARWAAMRITESELQALNALIADADSGAFAEIPDWDVEVDRAFHHHLAAAAKNPFLAESLGRLYNHSVRMLYATRAIMAPATDELPDYRFILDALRRKDPDRAEKGIQRHLKVSRAQITQGLGEGLASEAARR